MHGGSSIRCQGTVPVVACPPGAHLQRRRGEAGQCPTADVRWGIPATGAAPAALQPRADDGGEGGRRGVEGGRGDADRGEGGSEGASAAPASARLADGRRRKTRRPRVGAVHRGGAVANAEAAATASAAAAAAAAVAAAAAAAPAAAAAAAAAVAAAGRSSCLFW